MELNAQTVKWFRLPDEQPDPLTATGALQLRRRGTDCIVAVVLQALTMIACTSAVPRALSLD